MHKVHLTETCDTEGPHLITHVITTKATQQDSEVVDDLHQALANKDLLPNEHLLDQGYSNSHSLINAHERYDIEMLMPIRADHSWQCMTKGYDLSRFHIEWEAQRVRCPEGKISASWALGQDRKGSPRYEVKFNTADCGPCPARTLCTKSKRPRRKITFRPQEQYNILQTARISQQTEAFKSHYATRAGIEGTISQAVVAWRCGKRDITAMKKPTCSISPRQLPST